MSETTDFLEFVLTPKDAYAVLNRFGYHRGADMIKTFVNAGLVEKRDSMIRISKSGVIRLKEIKENASKPPVNEPITIVEEKPIVEERNSVSRFFLWISDIIK